MARAPLPANNVQATAPYRFIRGEWGNYVRAEAAALQPINEPKDGGLCAEITVEWEAETPLLIGLNGAGDDTAASSATPLVYGADNNYVIPGSTLRGAIRAVAEIASGARVTQVNRNRVFPLRDTKHKLYASRGRDIDQLACDERRYYPVLDDDRVKAGYLRIRSDGNYKSLPQAGRQSAASWNDCFELLPANGDGTGWSSNGRGQGFYFPPPETEVHLIDPEIMRMFRLLNSQVVEDELDPLPVWNEVLLSLLVQPGFSTVKVFFVGDPEDQLARGASAFMFGRPRLFKVPHAWDFDRVLQLAGIERASKPKIDEIDMVEALFGFVHEQEPSQNQSSTAPASLARKGRISFSSARLVVANSARVEGPLTTVMMGPRASYAPFYLRTDTAGYRDYSSPAEPKLAGLKRYPARHNTRYSNDVLNQVKATLERHNTGLPAQKCALSFLVPQDGQRLAFTSTIRLLNVTPAELGMVIWALTFGGSEGAERHVVGRAKSFGAGQMKPSISGIRVEKNDDDSIQKFKDVQGRVPYLDAFDRHVVGSGDAKLRAARIAWVQNARDALCHFANPENWSALSAANKLDHMHLDNFQDVRNAARPERNDPVRNPRSLMMLSQEAP